MNISKCLAAVGACVLSLLSACGGGTSQLEAFVPDRLLVFGDEHSVFTTEGRKYSVNALSAEGALDCENHPLWIQSVAAVYNYRFAQCLGTATESRAITYAVPGATVAGVRSQIDAQAATFTTKDLVLVMAGLHDVLEVYAARSTTDAEAQLLERARERGAALGAEVNRMVALGARVVVATMPDVGLSPWALAKGTADAALLSRLSGAFNGRVRVTILNDGRFVGLVLADELLQSAVQVPLAYGLSNVTTAVCAEAAPLPNCTSATPSLITGGDPNGYLWADSLRFGPTIHLQMGLVAASRARSNPF